GSSELCLVGKHQSPIDIIPTDYSKSQIPPPSDVRVKDVEEAELAHIVTTLEVAPCKEEEGKEGEGEAFFPAEFKIGDETFKLLQFHFHTPSEHRFD
ncbi:11412_t:CDS:1, partial [Racocetra fulgida]